MASIKEKMEQWTTEKLLQKKIRLEKILDTLTKVLRKKIYDGDKDKNRT